MVEEERACCLGLAVGCDCYYSLIIMYNMKKVFSLAMGFALALGCAFNAEAQNRNLKFNLGAGVAFPNVSSSGVSVDLKTTPYVYAGVDYRIAPQFALEGGLQWSMFGFKGLRRL